MPGNSETCSKTEQKAKILVMPAVKKQMTEQKIKNGERRIKKQLIKKQVIHFKEIFKCRNAQPFGYSGQHWEKKNCLGQHITIDDKI